MRATSSNARKRTNATEEGGWKDYEHENENLLKPSKGSKSGRGGDTNDSQRLKAPTTSMEGVARQKTLEVKDAARAAAKQRSLENARTFLTRQKQRGQYWIERLLIVLGVAVFCLAIVGAILLEQSETCKYPRFKLCESYTYKMDLKYPLPQEPLHEYFDGRVQHITGGKIKRLTIKQNYGTYRVLTDPDPAISSIKFDVCMRAKDKAQLTRMTSFKAANVHEEKLGKWSWFTNLNLETISSGNTHGAVTCQRADVTITIPTACMFEDTELHVEVERGNIDGSNMTTNFDTITLFNENGVISANQMSGTRINLNTSWGEVQANEVSAHLLFLQARTSGGVVAGSNLTVFSADNASSCNTTSYYREGFPERPEYLIETVVCDQTEGKVTVDTRGEDERVVDLNRFAGGSVAHVNKLGETRMRLMACVDFSGTFDIQADAIEIVQYAQPARMVETEDFNVYGRPILVLEEQKTWFRNFSSTSTRRRGEICQYGSGAEHIPGFVPQNMTLQARSIDTGLVRLEILEPLIDPDDLSSASGLDVYLPIIAFAFCIIRFLGLEV
mmetsp:Transcript_36268/g.68279  ORF Transcript_36268/g.68279 Transcript_36268/m.68279 type:complete len:558 (-) Transcript_36268:308-1981(-)